MPKQTQSIPSKPGCREWRGGVEREGTRKERKETKERNEGYRGDCRTKERRGGYGEGGERERESERALNHHVNPNMIFQELLHHTL